MLILPLSGQLLGSAFRAGRLSTEALGSEQGLSGTTLRDFFNGRRIGDDSRVSIFRHAAALMVRSELFPWPDGARQGQYTTELGVALTAWADCWDQMVTAWRVYGYGHEMQVAAAKAALRLSTLDVAVRVAGLASLLGGRAPDGLPRWADHALQQSGRGAFLAALVKRTDLTRDKLADRLAPHFGDGALDQHLAGTARPTEEHIEQIAKTLSGALPNEEWTHLRAELRRHYVLHELAAGIADVAGWDFVAELASVFLATWTATQKALASVPEHARATIAAMLFDCGAQRVNQQLFDRLHATAPNARWREALQASARNNWLGYFLYEARRVERLRDEPFDLAHPTTATEWSLRGWFALALLEDAAAIACFRKATQLDHANPEFHMDLSSALDGAHIEDGPAGERARLSEALVEVRVAQELKPGWREAVLAEAILLDALGDPEAAYRKLEKVLMSNAGGEDENNFRYHAAVMAVSAGRPALALRWLKNVLHERPDHAEALALAATCHQILRQEGKARARADQAASLGRFGVLPRRKRKKKH